MSNNIYIYIYIYILQNSYSDLGIILDSFRKYVLRTVLEISVISNSKLIDLFTNRYMILSYLRHSPYTRKSNIVNKVMQN